MIICIYVYMAYTIYFPILFSTSPRKPWVLECYTRENYLIQANIYFLHILRGCHTISSNGAFNYILSCYREDIPLMTQYCTSYAGNYKSKFELFIENITKQILHFVFPWIWGNIYLRSTIARLSYYNLRPNLRLTTLFNRSGNIILVKTYLLKWLGCSGK